jgi:hypothetical protein
MARGYRIPWWSCCTDVIRRNPLVKSLVRAKIVHKGFTRASIENVRFSYPHFYLRVRGFFSRNDLRSAPSLETKCIAVAAGLMVVAIFGTPIR